MSYFQMVFNSKDDWNASYVDARRYNDMQKKLFPLGWEFFSRANVSKILGQLNRKLEFTDIQQDLQYIYQTYGKEQQENQDLKNQIESLNTKAVVKINMRYDLQKERALTYSIYWRKPLQAGIIRNPERASTRDRKGFRAFARDQA